MNSNLEYKTYGELIDMLNRIQSLDKPSADDLILEQQIIDQMFKFEVDFC